MDSLARLHLELIGLLRQHCPVADERHLVLLGWMVAGLLLSQNVCFGHWQQLLPLHPCQASSWQRRCRRWLSNSRTDSESLDGPRVRWAMQQWQTPDQALNLALDTTVLSALPKSVIKRLPGLWLRLRAQAFLGCRTPVHGIPGGSSGSRRA